MKHSAVVRPRLYGSLVLGELCAARDTLHRLYKLLVASLNTKICFDTFADFFHGGMKP
jgi:hypothetical protein